MSGKLYIGLMSGTSLDALDVAICESNLQGFKQIAGQAFLLPEELRQQLLKLCLDPQVSLQTLGEVDHHFASFCADSINSLLAAQGIEPDQIQAIGSHGQTIFHSPNGDRPFTQQIGDANIIAAKTQIPCVADFRRMDMAYGGQGAPLVPAFHQALFAKQNSQRVIVNIGGIANITVLDGLNNCYGYDTGPGNLLMDAWVHLCEQKTYDKDAQFAAQGKVDSDLLTLLLSDPFFKLSPPKSTGREKFNLNWLQQQLQGFTLSQQDVQRTLLEFTAITISEQIQQIKANCEVYICGGGALNPLLMRRLTVLLTDQQVSSTQQLNIDPMFLEAVAFAWLAEQRLQQKAVALRHVTGASKDAILGCIYLP